MTTQSPDEGGFPLVGGRRLCLLGGGEHARVAMDVALLEGGWDLAGYWGPVLLEGISWLGTDEDLSASAAYWQEAYFHLSLAGAPGSGLRQRVLERVAALGLAWATLRHPRATLSPGARIGHGSFLGPGVVINTGADLAAHVLVNSGVIVEHDVSIGIGTHLCPGSVVGGGATVGAWATIGLGAQVRDHVRIGNGAVVGMGAVVLRDVPDGAIMVGNPARALSSSTRNFS